MIQLNLKELLEKNSKSKYWLVTQLDTNYTVVNRMINGETASISFKTIDRLLDIFHCSIDELFTDNTKPI